MLDSLYHLTILPSSARTLVQNLNQDLLWFMDLFLYQTNGYVCVNDHVSLCTTEVYVGNSCGMMDDDG